MKRLALLLVLVAAPARADDVALAPPPAYIEIAHTWYSPEGTTLGPPTDEEMTEVNELRLELSRAELEARGHCELIWTEAGDDTTKQLAVRDWMQKVMIGLRDSRYATIGLVEALFPSEVAEPRIADALVLLHDLYVDQMDTEAQVDWFYNEGYYDPSLAPDAETPLLPPCEIHEVSDNTRYNQSYYAAAAERALVEQFPDDDRRDDALADLVELYSDLAWSADLAWTLQEILCPGTNDGFSYGDFGGIYGGATIDYKACTPSTRLEGEELVSAWLALADQEHTMPGHRGAEIAARERAASVPGVEPQLGVLWELAQAYLASGQRVEAIPVLDELAEAAYADSTQIDLADQAVAKTGETLALLWRESSLPTPDAALKLAQIYFHQGRRKHPHVRGIFEALARALRELGAYEQAASVQREVVTAWPLHPMAPQAQAELIDIELERGDRDAADTARYDLIRSFGDGSAWVDANGADTAAVAVDDTRMALARSSYQKSSQLAERGEADADVDLRLAAITLSDVIQQSASPAHVVEAQFLLGQIQMLQKDGAGAATSFSAVVDVLPAGTPLREAAIGKLVRAREAAMSQAIAAKTLTLPAVPSDFAKQPDELPAVPFEVKLLHDAYDLLLTILDRDEDLAEGLLSAADLDLRYVRLDEAERELRVIVADHCFTGSARKARDVLVDLVRARDGAAAADEITKDVAARGCLDTAKAIAARDKELEKQLARARTLIGKGEFLTAARMLDKAYQTAPSTSALVDDVLLEAAQAWVSAGDDAAASDLLDELDVRPELASSPKLIDLQWMRAQLAQRRLDWPGAARAYLAVAALAGAAGHKNSAREVSALYNAAEMLAADHAWADRGNDPGAITLYLEVAKKAKEVGVTTAAWMRAAELAQRAGRREQLAAIHTAWRKAKIDRDHGLIVEQMEGEAAEAAGDRKGAETHYREVVTKGWKADGLGADALDAVIASKFWLSEEALRTDTYFDAFKWGKDQADDEKRLDAIADRIKELSKGFGECAEASADWRLAAAVRVADVTLEAIEAFVSAPPPEWLIQMMKDQGGARDTMTYTEGMRMLLESSYRTVAWQLTSALSEGIPEGSEPWARIAQQRLAEISSFVPDIANGARTEVFVEEVRP